MAKQKTRNAQLKKIFSVLDEDSIQMANTLIDEFCYMEELLKSAKEEIKKEGLIIHTTSGNGFPVTQINPAKQSYDNTYRNYSATWSKLMELLPKQERKSNELLDFLKDNQTR